MKILLNLFIGLLVIPGFSNLVFCQPCETKQCLQAQNARGNLAKTSNPKSEDFLKSLADKIIISARLNKETLTIYVIELESSSVIYKANYQKQKSGLYTHELKAGATHSKSSALKTREMVEIVFPDLEFEVH
ncbi:MAG: hypothetical protein KF862_26825 [Chitinophagaceae bacterium]|nr:hypothetical protein [Chitinophagaceae bacterium]